MAADPVIRPLDTFPAHAASPWCHSRGKRLFDLTIASVLFTLSLPFIVVAAATVKLSSRGPAMFKQRRVGLDGRPFTLLKLRTMRMDAIGAGVTRAGDARVTRLGRILRRTKIDELPQLVNVLRGEMSLVGPRPEVPEYVERYTPFERQLLTVRPGITGAASIEFRDEEAILASVPADEFASHYADVVVPRKARLELAYLSRASLVADIGLLLRTLAVVVRL